MTDLEFNQLQEEFLMAEKELGTETFTKHFREVLVFLVLILLIQ